MCKDDALLRRLLFGIEKVAGDRSPAQLSGPLLRRGAWVQPQEFVHRQVRLQFGNHAIEILRQDGVFPSAALTLGSCHLLVVLLFIGVVVFRMI
jgi:hypothetical protein